MEASGSGQETDECWASGWKDKVKSWKWDGEAMWGKVDVGVGGALGETGKMAARTENDRRGGDLGEGQKLLFEPR